MQYRARRRRHHAHFLASAAFAASPVLATNLNVNLLTNPGGESNTGASNFTSVVTPTGWTTTGNFTLVKYSIGTATDLNSADSTAISGGANYFAGGPNNPGATSTATQTVDISDLGASTANGYVGSLSAFLGGWGTQTDNMKINLQFIRSDGAFITDLTLGPVTNTDRGGIAQLLPVSQLFSIPAGTARLNLIMTATGGVAPQYNDGYADNLSLTLTNHRTVTWIGADTGDQWKDSTNWSAGGAPTNSAYDAVFDNGHTLSVQVNGPRNGGTLTLKSATTLTLNSGTLNLLSSDPGSLTVQGSSTLNLASDLTLNSGGARIAPAGTSGTGTVNVPAGASWTSSGAIQLGGATSTARLNVNGSVQADTLNSTSASFLTLSGGTVTVNSATLAGFLTGFGTLAGNFVLQGITSLSGNTSFAGLALKKVGATGASLTITNAPDVHVATFDGSDPGTSVSVGAGNLYLDSARGTSGANFNSTLSLAGGSLTSALPFSPTVPGNNAFTPTSITGFGIVSAPRLSYGPIPALSASGGSLSAHPGGADASYIALSLNPIRPAPSTTLSGDAILSTGGFVLQNTDTISGYGLIMGHIDDQTAGAGGLVPAGNFPDRSVFLPAGDVRLLAANSPTLALSNQNATTPTDFSAPNGATITSTAGSAPITLTGPITLANNFSAAVNTTVHPTGATLVQLPAAVELLNGSVLQPATQFLAPASLTLSGNGSLLGPSTDGLPASANNYNALTVTGAITLGNAAPAASFRSQSINVGTPGTPGDVVLVSPQSPTINTINVSNGSLTAPGPLNFTTATLGTPGSANKGSLLATSLTGTTLNLPGNASVYAKDITVANVTMDPASRHVFFDNTDKVDFGDINIHGGNWQLDGTVVAIDNFHVSPDTVLTIPSGAPANQLDVHTIGNLDFNGVVNGPVDGSRRIVHRGFLEGTGTFNVPVVIDGTTYEITDPDWDFGYVGAGLYPGPDTGFGTMTFNKGFTGKGDYFGAYLRVGGNQPGVTHDTIVVHGTLDITSLSASFTDDPDTGETYTPAVGEIIHLLHVDSPAARKPAVGYYYGGDSDVEFVTQNDIVNGSSIMITRKTADDDFVWFSDADNANLYDRRNWSNDSYPEYQNNTLRFTSAITAPRTLQGSADAAHVIFDSPISYTIGDDGNAGFSFESFDNSDAPAQLDVLQGSHTLGGYNYFYSTTRFTIAAGAALNLTPQATINVNEQSLILDGPGATPSLRAAYLARLLAAYHNGAWDLPGITSSSAQYDESHTTTLGYLDDGSSLTIKYTFYGDANLDGKLDSDDYALLDRAYASQPPSPRWSDGDFNYDGQVTPADYLLLDTAYAKQSGLPSPSFLSQRESQFGPDYVAQLVSAIPEPSSLACLVAPCLIHSRRRREKPA